MYLITLDTTYLDTLAELQKSDGSFERSNSLTALAILALQDSTTYTTEVENAKSWLREEQSEDYNWGSSVTDTAIVLYSAFSDEDITPASCDDAIQNQGEEGVDCGGPCDACAAGTTDECSTDSDCESLYGSDYYCSLGYCYESSSDGTCTSDDDCEYGYRCLSDQCIAHDCNQDSKCDYGQYDENSYNCPEDCYCGDGTCDSYESESSCSEDCGTETSDDDQDTYEPAEEEESSSGILIIIILLVLLLALGGGGYYAYSQGYLDSILGKFNKPKGPTFPNTQYKPFTSQQPSFGTQQKPPGTQ
jgi:hypothetical protein